MCESKQHRRKVRDEEEQRSATKSLFISQKSFLSFNELDHLQRMTPLKQPSSYFEISVYFCQQFIINLSDSFTRKTDSLRINAHLYETIHRTLFRILILFFFVTIRIVHLSISRLLQGCKTLHKLRWCECELFVTLSTSLAYF